MTYTINSPDYQVALYQQDTKLGLWALSVAQYGSSVYGDIFLTEEDARAELPKVLERLESDPSLTAGRKIRKFA